MVNLGFMEGYNPKLARNVAKEAVGMTREMREALDAPELPFLLTQYKVGARKTVIQQIPRAAQACKHVAVVPTKGLTYAADHHFDLEGQIRWAVRCREIIEKRGWLEAAGGERSDRGAASGSPRRGSSQRPGGRWPRSWRW